MWLSAAGEFGAPGCGGMWQDLGRNTAESVKLDLRVVPRIPFLARSPSSPLCHLPLADGALTTTICRNPGSQSALSLGFPVEPSRFEPVFNKRPRKTDKTSTSEVSGALYKVPPSPRCYPRGVFLVVALPRSTRTTVFRSKCPRNGGKHTLSKVINRLIHHILAERL